MVPSALLGAAQRRRHAHPGLAARSVRLLDARPDVTFVYGPAARHREGRPRPRVARLGPLPAVWDGQDWIERCARTGHNPVFSPEAVMRTELAQAAGGFREDMPLCADLALWLRPAARGRVAHLRGAHQAVYRLHPASMMHTSGWSAGLTCRERAFRLLVEEEHDLRAPDLVLRTARAGARGRAHRRGFADWQRLDRLPADDLLALAQRLWPDVVHSRAWAACERARSRARWSPVRLAHLVAHKGSSAVRDAVRIHTGR